MNIFNTLRSFLSTNNKNVWKIKILLPLFFIAIIGLFLIHYYVFPKEVAYIIEFDKSNNEKVKIEGIIKEHSLRSEEDGSIYEISNYILKKDEIQIDVQMPPHYKNYDSLVIDAIYKKPVHPTFEVGVKNIIEYRQNNPIYGWSWKYLYNEYIQEYKKYFGEQWIQIIDPVKNLVILQSENLYNSVDDFLIEPKKSLGKFSYIATINNPLSTQYTLSNDSPTPLPNNTVINSSFRGSFEMYVASHKDQKEVLINLTKQDFNMYKKPDIYEIIIRNEKNEIIGYYNIPDDGFVENENQHNPQSFSFSVPVEKGKISHITFSGSDDSSIRNINISTPYVFLENIYVVDIEKYFNHPDYTLRPFTFFTEEESISIEPKHESFSQELSIGETKHFIDFKTPNTWKIIPPSKNTSISTSKNDTYISGGIISLTSGTHLIAKTPHLEPYSYLNPILFNTLIADYSPIQGAKGIQSVRFPIKNIAVNKDNIISLKLRINDPRINKPNYILPLQTLTIRLKK